jgi:hypothetical protein
VVHRPEPSCWTGFWRSLVRAALAGDRHRRCRQASGRQRHNRVPRAQRTGTCSEGLRRQIAAVINELDYVPDRNARALAWARTDVIGIPMPSPTNNMFAEVVRDIYDGLSASHLQIQLANTHYSGLEEERVLQVSLSQRPFSRRACQGFRRSMRCSATMTTWRLACCSNAIARRLQYLAGSGSPGSTISTWWASPSLHGPAFIRTGTRSVAARSLWSALPSPAPDRISRSSTSKLMPREVRLGPL